MKIRTSALALAAVSLALAAPLRAQALPDARQLLEKHIEAVGGRAAVEGRQSVKITSTLDFPAVGLTGTGVTVVARPNRVAATMEFAGVGQIKSGFDGTVGWSTSPMTGPSLSEGEELEQTREAAGFLESVFQVSEPSEYRALETVERTEMGGRPCWKVKLTRASGRESFACFDVETGLIVGSQRKQVSRMGEMEMVSVLSDYKDFGGVKVATRTSLTVGPQTINATVTAVEWNAAEPNAFELPAEIKTLVGAASN